MRINLALLNILHSPRKTILSIAGIGTAVLLIFMQLGFRGAVENTATNIYGKLDFDVLLRSPDYLHFIDARQIPSSYLQDVGGMNGVESVNFLNVSIVNWRNPNTGHGKGILLLGVDPTHSPFRDRQVDRQFEKLTSVESLLIDRQSHPEFGPVNSRQFGPGDIGRVSEVARNPIQIVGLFSMGAGLAANGAAIVSDKGFERLSATGSLSTVTFVLVKLLPGQSAERFVADLKNRYRVDGNSISVEVLTRRQVIQRELDRWLGETPIGFIFTIGVFISFIVGAAIVYMVLSNDVANRLHEYATLRAMGYSNLFLGAVVLRQAGFLALFSFVPALFMSLVLYSITSWLANLAMEMNVARILVVLLLTSLMCGFSGTLALKKLWQVAPAELF